MTLPDAPRRERLANRNFRWMMAQIPETKHQRNRDQAIPKDKRACYLKEARAMLQGKDTRGKNRCQKLIGDD